MAIPKSNPDGRIEILAEIRANDTRKVAVIKREDDTLGLVVLRKDGKGWYEHQLVIDYYDKTIMVGTSIHSRYRDTAMEVFDPDNIIGASEYIGIEFDRNDFEVYDACKLAGQMLKYQAIK